MSSELRTPPPRTRQDFSVAIICALPLEAEYVRSVFDECWEDQGKRYGKAEGDQNTYTTGLIGEHNVVLAHMPNMGIASSAAAAVGIRTSFTRVQLALVVGICGAPPTNPDTGEEILLGDIVISTTVIQYDFGKQYPAGFERKREVEDTLGRANPEIQGQIAKLRMRQNRKKMTDQISNYLAAIQQEHEEAHYPGANRDLLYNAFYLHQHQAGTNRDKIAKAEKLTAFEMEGAGVWDYLPTLVIKAVCDYADSHKNKEWQEYAAATAAACLKAFLREWENLQPSPVETLANLEGPSAVVPVRKRAKELRNEEFMRIQTNSAEEIQCLNTLKGSVNYTLQKNRNDPCAEDSGRWFFNHPLFEEFIVQKGSQFLLATAEAGGGKSTVMRTLADKLYKSTGPPIVAFFFFKDDTDQLRSYEEAICSLVYQIIAKNKGLIKHVKPFCDRFGDGLKHNTEALWSAIVEIAAHTHQDIVCILDAADECEAIGRKQLVKDLKSFFHDSSRADVPLKFVVSSRPYQDEGHRYDELMFPAQANIRHLVGENREVQTDIDKVIRSKAEILAQKRRLDPAIRELLIKKLTAQNQQIKSFLAVRMAFELLDHDREMVPGAGEQRIKKILARIPRQLGDQFDEMLNRSRDPQHAYDIFCAILAARKTIKIDELKVIYALTEPLEPGLDLPESYDDLDEMSTENRDFKQRVRATCGLFITFVGKSVHLFHQTAREHLLKHTQQTLRRPLCPFPGLQANQTPAVEARPTWKNSISLADANLVSAEICLRILNFDVPPTLALKAFCGLEAGNTCHKEVNSFVKHRPLLLYAALNWHEHIQLADRNIHEIFKLGSYNSMLDLSMPQFWGWFLIVADYLSHRGIRPGIYKTVNWPISSIWEQEYQTKLSCTLLWKVCISQMFSVDEKLYALFKRQMILRTPDPAGKEVCWTSSNGFHLIDQFHLACEEYEYISSAQAVHAIEAGENDRAALLSTDIPLNEVIWSSIQAGTPRAFKQALVSIKDLTWLHEIPDHIIRRRVRWGDWKNKSEKELREIRHREWENAYPPSFVAIMRSTLSRSHQELWNSLADWLDNSPEKGKYSRQIWEAGGFIVPSLARRLLTSGVPVDLEMWDGCRTALQIAATFWEHNAVQELLKLGADPIKSAPNGYNALDWFLIHEELYLGDFIYFGPTDPEPELFRHHYLRASIVASIRAMIEAAGNQKNVLLNHQCNVGETPLMRAVQSPRSSPTAVKTLLKEGALINTQDKNKETALMKFFYNSGFRRVSISILRQLLQHGANPLTTDQNGRTALEYWRGQLASSYPLDLHSGFNTVNESFDALANIGPLSDPDVLIQQISGMNLPLIAAVWLGNTQLCSALMAAGADPKTAKFDKDCETSFFIKSQASEREEFHWNPLLAALKGGAYTTAVLLIEHGADVNVEAPRQKRTRLNKYDFNKGGTTALHLILFEEDVFWVLDDLCLSYGDQHQGCSFQSVAKRNQAEPQVSTRDNKPWYRGWGDKEINFESDYEIVRKDDSSVGVNSQPYDTMAKVKHGFEIGDDPLIRAIIDQDLDSVDRRVALVEYLLLKGASCNARTVESITPLFLAARAGIIPAVEILLKHGADPNICTSSGSTPLMVAAAWGHEEIVELLLKANADAEAQQYVREPGKCDCRDFIGWRHHNFFKCKAPLTALALASDRGQAKVVKLLLKAGADPNRQIIHHAHGRLSSEKEKRMAQRLRSFRRNDSDHSGGWDEIESEPELWKGFIHVGTALTWAEGECHDLLLQAGATRQDTSKECECIIKRRVIKDFFYDSYGEDESDNVSSHEPPQSF